MVIDEDGVKKAFLKVREDIQRLEEDLKNQKEVFLAQQRVLEALNEQSGNVLAPISNFKINKDVSKISSTGNEGVLSTVTVTATPLPTLFRQPFDNSDTDDPITKDIKNKFRSLTEREFAVFMVIYQLEEELNYPITYADVARKLSLSRSSVRDHIGELLLKNAPLVKTVSGDRKVSLSIKKDFRDLNLVSKLLSFRNSPEGQRQLHAY